jgi:ribose 1,5-bisphosphokinase PhnN
VVQIEGDPVRLAERLRARGSSAAEVAARLADNRREVVAGRAVADRVLVNDGTLDELADRLVASVLAPNRLAAAS